MNEVPIKDFWWLFLILGVLLIAQGTILFLHARRHGRRAWLWGLWGLTYFPIPSLLYFLLHWWKKRKAKAPNKGDRED
ncbi:sigmaY antisigma factor component [Cohnella abietis]|uniref:SigmaY antisigma factor component n=1 Tax=Cohnella abietis TaxID=2507935 RepID=A0A3T1DBA2_9BACL|nr:sigmaY antisigma factor component [Cohnella abietis]BBI35258.1 hypothetical protein KCTCHS21_46570 [Cohnella abietis]